jgi:hypothetical protein
MAMGSVEGLHQPLKNPIRQEFTQDERDAQRHSDPP